MMGNKGDSPVGLGMGIADFNKDSPDDGLIRHWETEIRASLERYSTSRQTSGEITMQIRDRLGIDNLTPHLDRGESIQRFLCNKVQ